MYSSKIFEWTQSGGEKSEHLWIWSGKTSPYGEARCKSWGQKWTAGRVSEKEAAKK